MTHIERARDRYHTDPVYRAFVEGCRKVIEDLVMSPSEVREAAMFAYYLVEVNRPTILEVKP